MAKKIKRRITRQEDVDRLAERLLNERGKLIKDRESFDQQYSTFLQEPDPQSKRNTVLRQKVFNSIRTLNPDVRDGKPKIKPESKGRFDVSAKSKGKVVFAKQMRIKRRGKFITVLRDRRGRFVKKAE